MRKLFLLLFSLLIFSFVALIIWLYIAFSTLPISSSKTPITFIVPKGATVTQIADLLHDQGVNQNTHYLLLLAKTVGKLKQVKAGEYQIAPNATPQQLIAKLAKGQVLLHKITFPEGWTFNQIMTALAAEPRLSHTLVDSSNESAMAVIGHSGEHPEGMFYPDTYLFTLDTKDTQILNLAYNLMQKKLAQAWTARAPDVPYKTAYEALIVASLIEKEAAVPNERPMVAGVILRRLKIGMRLQIDAAVLYGVPDKNRHSLTRTDLATDTPYNTYTRNGLPPTPIAMPGSASINAALHPTAGTALYYVAKGDGSHVFSDNLQGHRAAVQAYRQQLRFSQDADYLQPYPEAPEIKEYTQAQCFSARLMMNFWASWGSSESIRSEPR